MTKELKVNWREAFFILIPLIILTSLCGCKEKKQSNTVSQDPQSTAQIMEESTGKTVIRVMMDLPTSIDPVSDALPKSLYGLPGYEQDFILQVESIEAKGINRDNALTRLRTEIMAGDGPDLFICAHRLYGGFSADPEDMPFFRFPEKAMSNHIFLQLDEYIEKAEYMEWDKLQSVVMDAGKNEEGQQILPLSYTFTATFFDKDYTPKSKLPMTWVEMIEDPDPFIRASAANIRLYDIIGDLADYSKDVPAFTEEELRTFATKEFTVRKALAEQISLEEQPVTSPVELQNFSRYDISLNREKEYTIVPASNLLGGVTANITTFAAINRNTRYPDEAFKVLDYLLSPKIQQTSPLFQSRMEGLPVYVNTGDENTPPGSAWKMNESNFKGIYEIQKQINIAKFPGPLDVCIWQVETEAYDEKTLEKAAHEQYVLMEMLLAES